jgi:hypothetical protein
VKGENVVSVSVTKGVLELGAVRVYGLGIWGEILGEKLVEIKKKDE